MNTNKMKKPELLKLVEELNTENSEITDELIATAKELKDAYDYCHVSTRLAYIAKYAIEEVLDSFDDRQLSQNLQQYIHAFAKEMQAMILNIEPKIQQEINKRSGVAKVEQTIH